jgi:CopG antitoxin of type II toxin-antitoxin system
MTLRLPADLMGRLKGAARKQERAVAQLVRLLLKEGLDRLEGKG